MDFLTIIEKLIFSFATTYFFTLLFGVRKLNIRLMSSLSGMLSYGVYIFVVEIQGSVIVGSFAGAFIVGVLGEYFSTTFRAPATIFIIPGIFPLVPGYGMYYTMLHLVSDQYDLMVQKGTETFFIAMAIAMGIMLAAAFRSTTIARVVKRSKEKRHV